MHCYGMMPLGGSAFVTIEELMRKIMNKYFLSFMFEKLRIEIHQFCQDEGESFQEAWEIFQELLRRCPIFLMEKGYE